MIASLWNPSRPFPVSTILLSSGPLERFIKSFLKPVQIIANTLISYNWTHNQASSCNQILLSHKKAPSRKNIRKRRLNLICFAFTPTIPRFIVGFLILHLPQSLHHSHSPYPAMNPPFYIFQPPVPGRQMLLRNKLYHNRLQIRSAEAVRCPKSARISFAFIPVYRRNWLTALHHFLMNSRGTNAPPRKHDLRENDICNSNNASLFGAIVPIRICQRNRLAEKHEYRIQQVICKFPDV